MSADLSRLLKELQDFGVPEQRSCEIAAELIRVGARTVFAQLGEIAGKNEATPWEIGYYPSREFWVRACQPSHPFEADVTSPTKVCIG